jgi:hypothetical protein
MVIVYPFKLDAMGGLITTPIQHDTQLPNQAELMKEMLVSKGPWLRSDRITNSL